MIFMKKLWQNEYTLRAGDFDRFDRIKLSSVLDLFQDAAGQHSEESGLGFYDMLERNYLWVVTRVKFKILSQPVRYQTVVVKTWPLAPNRFNYRRECCIEDSNGKKLIVGSSEWVIINSATRHFVSVPDLYSFDDGFHEEVMFEEKLGKLHDFESETPSYTVSAGFSELDINGHVNNTKYADYAMDAINPSKDDAVEEFQIDYRKEIMLGTPIDVYCKREENLVLAKGQNKDGDVMFICKADFK